METQVYRRASQRADQISNTLIKGNSEADFFFNQKKKKKPLLPFEKCSLFKRAEDESFKLENLPVVFWAI